MTAEICVDANLIVMLYTPEEMRNQAVLLLNECLHNDISIIAPDVIWAEVDSAIRRKVYRGLLELDDGKIAISLMSALQINHANTLDLIFDAWRIADAYNLPTLYDAYYLAIAELRGCDFWTADERFVNSVKGLSYVRPIRDYSPGILE